jgi:hypothetical protein
MIPWLERGEVWHDFHTRFIPAAATAIGRLVAPRYFTKIEEQLYVHEPSAQERASLGRPKISVHPHATHTGGFAGASVATLDEPATVGLLDNVDIERVRYLEVRDRHSREVVTVVELLSPSNKNVGADRTQYVAKVKRILESRTNFIELDFLRGGPRMSWSGLPPCDYYALVSRAGNRLEDTPHADVWAFRLRDPLPRIPIPLRAGEPEPQLDLQSVLNEVYDSSEYPLYIYDGPPEPPLSAADAQWAEQLLRASPAHQPDA